MPLPVLSRRRLMLGAGAASAFAAMPAWAQGHSVHRQRGGAPIKAGFDEVGGPVIDLAVGHGPRVVQGRKGHGIAVNGSVPGPLVRLQEGQDVQLNVTNNLGRGYLDPLARLRCAAVPDGQVCRASASPGSRPAQTFALPGLPVRQAGTFWYH